MKNSMQIQKTYGLIVALGREPNQKSIHLVTTS